MSIVFKVLNSEISTFCLALVFNHFGVALLWYLHSINWLVEISVLWPIASAVLFLEMKSLPGPTQQHISCWSTICSQAFPASTVWCCKWSERSGSSNEVYLPSSLWWFHKVCFWVITLATPLGLAASSSGVKLWLLCLVAHKAAPTRSSFQTVLLVVRLQVKDTHTVSTLTCMVIKITCPNFKLIPCIYVEKPSL